ncbi:hypothetical protein COT82_02195 [Candidatus Campbellbacteria bacterium CG10_big_fil_rev_8_21_14_0_10_35_52]|uniref:Excinuclease ABC subunit C n=1 Tax=Candidatus Campbellbacteria bacterium CG10_big_fil_rev_8_21_14_0_10_35_52 TaxID=1974527 RepID=A0A2M6WVA6_9BACT|nr:MAG: hypothetical protein COT82_02195 [Candidatus Campbellbacteria bacterium CG10_big_fil_rev_8_21_14_0_10_35_52]
MKLEILKKLKISDSPGVYFFKKGKKILYIGKATSLRNRVKSYFNKDILMSRGLLIEKMLGEANLVSFIKTDSVLEALILESNLIKKYQPKYNTKEKDDKSFNFVVITKEDFPRVLIVRGKDIRKKYSAEDVKYLFGPFPYGNIFNAAMKIIRKMFPFRDVCFPHSLKPCFNRQIGLCPGVCVGEVSKIEYRRIINHIKLFFEGKKSLLIKSLKSEMLSYAKKKRFEEANTLKKTIFALNHIQDISLIKEEFRKSPINFFGERLLKKNNLNNNNTRRIEAYDVAHTGGVNTVGVMAVVENGMPKKVDYRKFNISDEVFGNDTLSLEKILDRRLRHNEWQFPYIIAVDGGKAQVNITHRVLDKYGYKIIIVGVVKNEKHKIKMIIGDKKIITNYEKEILLANYEAHRFALSFHHDKFKLK